MSKAEQPVLFFATPAELDAWMDEHAEESDGIWLKFAKKASGIKSVVYAEAVEIALSHGWIDGQAKRLDDDHYLQRFTPRRSRSKWSRIGIRKHSVLPDPVPVAITRLRRLTAFLMASS